MTKIQKHMLSLEAVVEMKEKIVNDKAVYYIERAVYLIRQWLNEHTDVSYELYDLLDNDETGIRYSLKQKGAVAAPTKKKSLAQT